MVILYWNVCTPKKIKNSTNQEENYFKYIYSPLKYFLLTEDLPSNQEPDNPAYFSNPDNNTDLTHHSTGH